MDGIDVTRFFAKVDKNGSTPLHMPHLGKCWLWLGGRNGRGHGLIGYGAFSVQRRMQPAHRVSWVIHHGRIPSRMRVLHHCDNPPCVNPEHLWLGSQFANVSDMIGKGRDRRGIVHLHGPANGMMKIPLSIIAEIRSAYASGKFFQRELAAQYGVSQGHVSEIIRGKKRPVA